MVRMEKVSGRTDDMFIIRGVNVFPSQIESILMEIEGAEPHYQLVLRKSGVLDELEVQVEVNEGFFSDEIRQLEVLEQTIQDRIESVLGLEVHVRLIEPRSLQRGDGKAQRLIDQRDLADGY
jgi:phenylacetate-CoA ligase